MAQSENYFFWSRTLGFKCEQHNLDPSAYFFFIITDFGHKRKVVLDMEEEVWNVISMIINYYRVTNLCGFLYQIPQSPISLQEYS